MADHEAGWREGAADAGRPSKIRAVRRGSGRVGLLAALLLTGAALLAEAAHAQPRTPQDSTAAAPVDWQVLLGGRPERLPDSTRRRLGRLPEAQAAQAAALILPHLQAEGRLLARVDSAGRSGFPARPTLYASRGPDVPVASLALRGMASLDSTALRARLDTRPGTAYRPERLAADLDFLLAQYERAGFVLAAARPRLEWEAEAQAVHIQIDVDEGGVLRLDSLALDGGKRTSPRFVSRATGLEVGRPLVPYDPAAIRRDLEESGLFESVGAPRLAVSETDGAVLTVPVEERPPGLFDVVLGLQPEPGGSPQGRGRLALVGTGRLVLENLFGGGRRLDLRLVRNPGLVAEVEAAASDPYLAGLPLRATVAFRGYSQDSTFGQQRYGAEAGFRLAPGLEIIGAANVESTSPGPAGRRLGAEGVPLVPASSATFAGFGVRYRRVDSRANPRRGLAGHVLLETGRKTRRLLGAADSVRRAEPGALPQQRLTAEARFFMPTLRRQVFVTGGDLAVLLAERYDRAELFRYGGARSLRGYDEERFLGSVVGRAVFEYRYQLDRTSFAFAFADVGYVRRPQLEGVPAEGGLHPGYGFGLQYRTPLGLVTLSYALNPEDGALAGKVHAGLAVGL